ncbi:MAG TPA: hypothetical protein VIJ42_00515 [Stellaceae bacterium]
MLESNQKGLGEAEVRKGNSHDKGELSKVGRVDAGRNDDPAPPALLGMPRARRGAIVIGLNLEMVSRRDNVAAQSARSRER